MKIDELRKRDVEAEINRLKKHIRENAGVHKKTKLKRARGKVRRKTLLDDAVSNTHANRLIKQFLSRWDGLPTRSARNRLRLMTILDSVCSVDEQMILNQVEEFEKKLDRCLEKMSGIEVMGCFEIEIVSWNLMESLKIQSNATDDQVRKYTVLKRMNTKTTSLYDEPSQEMSSALIHFHGMIDFGIDADEKIKKLKEICKKTWTHQYQVEFDPLHANKRLRTNLTNIAKYLVKGGNESLLYKIGFGADSVEKYEAAMLKKGEKQLGADFEGIENEFSLTQHEIKVLDAAIDLVMARKKKFSNNANTLRNGYLYRHGQQVKWVK